MIIPEAQSILITYFSDNDAFSIKEDFLALIHVSETPEADKAAIQGALDGFVHLGLLVKANEFYILTRKIDLFEQTVILSAMSAVAIADLLNEYCKISGNQTVTANPIKITSENILILTQLANKGLFYHSQELEEARADED